ncbi:hypothetical protein GM415_06395 [Pseudodesulfovibrio cashew]|uniref:Uncharacterized protein n=1 Tax=Pseudodesulfovibrio cashew TaxID=2678688 RepID=A0A6I6JQ32_9BACT|nr:hypothetical protein [Pseudodesulfovibrio cashew]QGY39764.1 hypothetical protein GM415_06395 [Pseudodesulfovibrio cashew]
MVEYEFGGRSKIIKGYSYPIKRGDLDQALDEAGVTDIQRVAFFCLPKKGGGRLVLLGYFFGEARLDGLVTQESPDITVCCVPTQYVSEIKSLLEKHTVLNRLDQWVKQIELAENVYRDQRHGFHVCYEDEALVVEVE